MPLIQDLKNPAMRERHWTQLQDEIQKSFDHTSMTFIDCLEREGGREGGREEKSEGEGK